MFESLQERLGSILNGLTGRGALSEADVAAALREVRRALLEADVALEVVRSFTDKVREKAVGAAVLKSIKPGQMVVKIVLMASLDTRRPAAQEQLRQLGEQTKVATLPIIAGQSPVDIAKRAVQA